MSGNKTSKWRVRGSYRWNWKLMLWGGHVSPILLQWAGRLGLQTDKSWPCGTTDLLSPLSSAFPRQQILLTQNHDQQMLQGVSSLQLVSCVWLFATPWVAARQASLSITNYRSSFRLKSIESVMPSSHLILCHLQSLPASESFPMSQLFAWGGQSTGVSASASFPLKKSQGWSPSEWTGWISLQSKGLSRVFSTPQFKSINSSVLSLLHSPTLTSIHDHRKNHSLD